MVRQMYGKWDSFTDNFLLNLKHKCMKKIRFFAVITLLMVCATSFAQFTNSSSSSSSSSDTEGWSSFWVEWNPSSLSPDKGDDQSFTGLSLGFSEAFGIAQSLPLFVECGLGLQYSFYSEDIEGYYEDCTMKVSMFSVKAPVNLVYKYCIPNSNIALCPYAGVNLRFNVSGKEKYDYGDDEDEYNLFDEDDMDDYAWKRFQIGWQIGAKVMFNKSFTLGVSYGTDFSEICEKTKIKTTSVALGFCF